MRVNNQGWVGGFFKSITRRCQTLRTAWTKEAAKSRRQRRSGLSQLSSLEPRTLLAAFVVNSAADNTTAGDGLTTLREAIALANANAGADTITFGNGAGIGGTDFTDGTADTITLSLGEMVITESLTITGKSAAQTIINGNNASRIFSITSGDTTLEKLTLTGGRTTANSEKGGAIRSTTTGKLTVRQSTLSGNSTVGNYAHGGAIYSIDTAVTVTQCTLSGNSTTGTSFGGAMSAVNGLLTVSQSTLSGNSTTAADAPGGAIFFVGDLMTVSQSTLSDNSTSGIGAHGGAIYAWGGPLKVIQSTLTGNRANLDQGGGIHSFFSAITIQNSIVAGNTDNGTAPDILKHTERSLTVSHSLIGDNTGTGLAEAQTADGTGNFIGSSTGGGLIDPQLGPLQNNGGPMFTHALLTGSLAINAGSNASIPSGVSADQRGFGPRITDSTVDIGAYEFGAVVPESINIVVTTHSDVVNSFDGLTSLREAIAYANSHFGADTITFGDGSAIGGTNFTDGTSDTISLSLGQIEISESVTITGQIAANTVIDAQQNSRIFDITVAAGDVTLEKLTLTNGRTTGDNSTPNNTDITNHGGAIRSVSHGILTISQSTLSGNSTTGAYARGGAVYSRQGEVVITRSLITGNSTAGLRANGGAVNANNTVSVSQSTFTGNSTSADYSSGGAIFSVSSVAVDQSTFSNNSTAGKAAVAGAISASIGTITVSRSTFSGNSTLGQEARGGAIFGGNGLVSIGQSTFSGNSTAGVFGGGGAISAINETRVTQSTFSGNSTTGDFGRGGAIFINDGPLQISQSTITGNRSANGTGGGVYSFSAAVTIQNSIVAGNTNNIAPDIRKSTNVDDAFTVSHSLIGNNTGTELIATVGATPDSNGNFIGGPGGAAINPLVGPLQNNGGGVLTHSLLPGSLALNHGDNTQIPLDTLDLDGDLNTSETVPYEQRGALFSRVFAGAVDMGAFESQSLNLVVDTSVDENDGNYAPGDLSLREAILLANANPGADTIAFGDGSTFGGTNFTDAISDTISLTLGQMAITDSLTITGQSSADTVIDANQISRIFDVTSTAGNVTLANLTMTNGRTTGANAAGSNTDYTNNGGAIRANAFGTLTISRSTLSGNSTTGDRADGGAIFISRGALNLSQCTLSGNSTSGVAAGGGGVFSKQVPIVVSQSTISGNSTTGGASGGGAIYALTCGVTVSDSSFTDNSTTGVGPNASGGAVLFAGNVASNLSLTVNNSSFMRNTTTGANASGGAIWAMGIITVNQCVLNGNSTTGNVARGGAIFAESGGSVNQSTLSGNSTAGTDAGGGAIFSNRGEFTVSQSTLSGNLTLGFRAYGGAIVADTSTIVVKQSTLQGNSTAGVGANGGAISARIGSVTVLQSTFSGNVTTGSNAHGGAVSVSNAATVTVSQSTLSGNITSGSGARGGAISAIRGSVLVIQSTVTGNRSTASSGGGIYSHSAAVAIQNSIISLNTDIGTAPDVRKSPTNSITVSHSLIGDNTGTDLTEAQAADGSGSFIGSSTGGGIIDPHLGALANNGGPTKSHALLAGSLALNSGSNSLIPVDTLDLDGDSNTTEVVPFDQRGVGFARIGGGTVDMGALEAQPPVVALVNTVVSLAENTSTSSQIRVADIVITHDGLGTNTLSLTGADAAAFEIVGNQLFLKSGLALNFEAKSAYQVTVNVDDARFPTNPDSSVNFTLTLTNVAEAPVVSGPLSFSFEEFSPRWTIIGKLNATDSDGDSLAYSIVSGNFDNTLFIGDGSAPADGGRLWVYQQDLTGLRHRGMFNLKVRVTDNSTQALFTEVDVQVFILPTQNGSTKLTASVDGAVSDAGGNGFDSGDTVDSTGTGMLVQGGATPSRGVMEFDLRSMPTNRVLKSAWLFFSTSALAGGATVNVPIDIFGYAGHGSVDAADATQGTKIGVRRISNADGSNQLKIHSAQLDTGYLRTLIGNSQLGLVLRNDTTSDGVVTNTSESSVSSDQKPYLILQFGDLQPDLFIRDNGATGTGNQFLTLGSDGSSFTVNTANVFAVGSWERFLTGDFNGDGRTDIAGRLSTDGTWWISLANPSGIHQAATQWGTWIDTDTWNDVLAADFDGDGKTDIAGRVASGDWWVSRSTGTALSANLWGNWSSANTWSNVTVGDFNRDGRMDIAGRNNLGEWFVSRSTGTTPANAAFATAKWGQWSTTTNWTDVQIGDFNGDGRTDIAGRSSIGQWWVNRSTGSTFGAAIYYGLWSTNTTWSDVRVADFNGDGRDDILGRSTIGQWWVAETAVNSSFTMKFLGQRTAPQSQWGEMVVGDFNRDGRADIATRNTVDNTVWVSLWTITGNTPSFVTTKWATLPTAGSPQWRLLRSGRLNG